MDMLYERFGDLLPAGEIEAIYLVSRGLEIVFRPRDNRLSFGEKEI